jgi:hypothetical protein
MGRGQSHAEPDETSLVLSAQRKTPLLIIERRFHAAVFICGNLGLSVVGYLVKDLQPLIHTDKH